VNLYIRKEILDGREQWGVFKEDDLSLVMCDPNLNYLETRLREKYPHVSLNFPPETNTQSKDEPALRYDEGKIPYHLFPLDAYEEICKVMAFGAKKYSARNWEKGMSWSRVSRSMFSHFFAMCRGETHDAESGCRHSAHMAWNAVALCSYDIRKVMGNDLIELYHGPVD
jgi:hypothetical protein